MLFLERSVDLSDFDLDIYKYICNNLQEVSSMRIRELASSTHTSTTSILRFCKKFGCSGFSEFKIKLKIFLDANFEDVLKNTDETNYIDFLNRTMSTQFQSKINEAVKILESKELVLFIGVGSSNIIAEYGALYFSSIFNMALRIEDPSNYPVNFLSKSLSDKICVIALSVSGETVEIINYLNHLNFSNSSIISITNSAKSTIAKLSDVNIPYYIGCESLKGADITSQLPALYIVESLAKRVKKNQENINSV